MFISKKEYEALKKKVEEQDKLINNMVTHMVQMQYELNELKKPKKDAYFG